ncbi:MAG: DNA primase [Candidatus Aenigmatarchaeota archaeon]|nr:MAG: DNA primase [Candidatus Aenigmarchaeota archaeon]
MIMSKLAPTSIKYMIKAHIKAKGVVEKPDIIGAIFGQTEGLLGSELDLRELQRTGRIGRIEVNIKSSGGSSEGDIIIPSSLDSAETALIAATLETIERVGPCTAEIKLLSVEDTRSEKRKYVVEKAKVILKQLTESGLPDTSEISEQIKEAVRAEEISSCDGLPCGPNILDSDEIIVVEGRADILNLLRYGIRNTIAIEGTSVPPAIKKLCKEKSITIFVDGDRGGQLIAKEIMKMADVDYVATAPEGKEVEELTKKEAYKALREKIPAELFKSGIKKVGKKPEVRKGERPRIEKTREIKRDMKRRPGIFRKPSRMPGPPKSRPMLKPDERELFKKTLEELVGTRAACIFDEKCELMGKVPVTELINTLKTTEKPYAVVFDGRVDSRLNDIAKFKGVRFLIGMDKDRFPSPIAVLSKRDL